MDARFGRDLAESFQIVRSALRFGSGPTALAPHSTRSSGKAQQIFLRVRAWITCTPDNAASIRTIERLGAHYVETVQSLRTTTAIGGANVRRCAIVSKSR